VRGVKGFTSERSSDLRSTSVTRSDQRRRQAPTLQPESEGGYSGVACLRRGDGTEPANVADKLRRHGLLTRAFPVLCWTSCGALDDPPNASQTSCDATGFLT